MPVCSTNQVVARATLASEFREAADSVSGDSPLASSCVRTASTSFRNRDTANESSWVRPGASPNQNGIEGG